MTRKKSKKIFTLDEIKQKGLKAKEEIKTQDLIEEDLDLLNSKPVYSDENTDTEFNIDLKDIDSDYMKQ